MLYKQWRLLVRLEFRKIILSAESFWKWSKDVMRVGETKLETRMMRTYLKYRRWLQRDDASLGIQLGATIEMIISAPPQ